MENKSLTQNGITIPAFIYGLLAVLMIGVSIYLTSHYYEVIYPTELGGGSSLCDISSFLNCDAATYSPLAAIAGIPISFFGIVVGFVFILSLAIPSAAHERTASVVAKLNLIGCLVLFAYSLVVLGSLCPWCSVYYILSALVVFMFWRYSENSWSIDPKIAVSWLVVVLVGGGVFNLVSAGKQEKQISVATQTVAQFNTLANYGDPEVESPYKIHVGGKSFAESAIRVTIFSDFQCPFCQRIAEQTHKLVRLYGDKISVQYMFYPLDSSCNASMKSQMHPYACRAAMLAACDPSKFAKVHDEIFAAQEGLNLDTLKKIADSNGLTQCFESQATKDAVVTSINQAPKYNLKSTPTLIINGRKIEGGISTPQFQAIFDDLVRQAK